MVRSRGFSLLELVFVFIAIAVVGIVLALTTTDVLESNARRRADRHGGEVVIAQQSFAQRYGTYTGYPPDLGRFSDFDVVLGPSDGPDEVSIAVGVRGTAGVAVRRDENVCLMWKVIDLASGGGSKRLSPPRTAVCDGAEALGSEPLHPTAATTSRAEP